MKCTKCHKVLKENTNGDIKYCQGHSPLFTDEDEVSRICEVCDRDVLCCFGDKVCPRCGYPFKKRNK